jgi:CheY-like chemotaxis protein
MMPFVSGVELARQVHNNSQTATIPVVLMSAAMPEHVDDLFAAVIHKPFSVDTIVRTIRQFLLG